jgi:hypothetical protein
MSSQPQSSRMPLEIAELHGVLEREVLTIHREWLMFHQVFTCPERSRLLFRVASTFFHVVHWAIYRNVLMSLFRLIDPPDHGKKRPNLALERLITAVGADDFALSGEMGKALAEIRSRLEPHEALRDKVIAHNDLATTSTLYDGTSKMTVPCGQAIEKCLELVRDMLNLVNDHYGCPQATYWNPTFPPPGDGEELIRHLQTLARLEGWNLGGADSSRE